VALARLFGGSRPLLMAVGRIFAAALIAVSVATTVALSVWIQHSKSDGSVNDRIDAKVISATTGHRHLLTLLEAAGDLRTMAVLTLLVAGCCAALRNWRGVLLAAFSVPLAGALTEYVLKPLISGDSWAAFPSGHTTAGFALATLVAVVAASTASRVPAVIRGLAALAFLALAVAIGIAMIGLSDHFFTDTVGGAAVGVTVVLGGALVIDGLAAAIRVSSGQHASRQPASPGPPAPARAKGSQ
jgi:membrane-associated phospholipid phosphatase